MATRDTRGRFLPTGGSARGGSDPAARAAKIVRLSATTAGSGSTIELVPESRAEGDTGEGGGVSIESDRLALDLDARGLVDVAGTALLLYHRGTIIAGRKPDGSGNQPPIGPKARMKRDRLSPRRGFSSGLLADELRRGKISGTAEQAATSVSVPPSRNAFAAAEAGRGNFYLTVGGAAGEAMRAAVAEWAAGIAAGEREHQAADRKAKETAGGG